MTDSRDIRSIFSLPLSLLTDEFIETLLETDGFILERIVSEGHTTPEGTWYDQEMDEWVMLLSGSAGLRFAHSTEILEMRPGDHILIPAHVHHRVEWTDGAQRTFWLALHFRRPAPASLG